MEKWSHDDLAFDLAQHLKAPDRLVWCDMQIGPSGSPRPDVFTLQKSYSRPTPTSYECKISVSDFRSDITSGKWQAYLNFSGAVTFAVPSGLISKADVPNGCGLMFRGEENWTTVRKPTRQIHKFSADAMMKLLIDGWGRELSQIDQKRSAYFESRANKILMKKFGKKVADVIHDLAQAERMVEYYNEKQREVLDNTEQTRLKSAKAAREAADEEWRDLRRVVGLPETASRWDIEREVRRLRDSRPSVAQDKLTQALENIRRQSENVLRETAIVQDAITV